MTLGKYRRPMWVSLSLPYPHQVGGRLRPQSHIGAAVPKIGAAVKTQRKNLDSTFVGDLILKSVIIGSVDRADYEMARRSYRLRSARFHLPRSSRHMCLDCATRPVFNQSRISADKYFLDKISFNFEKKCVQHFVRNSPFSHKKASFSSWHLQLQNCDSWNKRASRCN